MYEHIHISIYIDNLRSRFELFLLNAFHLLSLQNLETDLAETREQIKSLHRICSHLSSQVDVKQEELFQKRIVIWSELSKYFIIT